jgi:hypothetical protein
MTGRFYSAHRIRASMVAFAIGKGISAPLSFLLILLLAAMMSRTEYASYIATVAVLEIGFVLGTLGIDWVTQTVIAGIRVRGNAAQLRHAVLLLGVLPTVPYLFLAGALWQFAPQLSSALGGVATVEVLRLYAVVLAIEGPTRMLRDSLMAVLLLQRTAQVSQVLRVLVTFSIVAAMALTGTPIEALDVARAEILAASVSLVAAVAAVAWFLWSERPRRRMTDDIGAWVGWGSVKFASHAYGSLLMMLLVGTDMMTALIARYLGADATAAFGFVVRLVETARRYLPMDMFWGVLRPAAIGRHADSGRDMRGLMRDVNRMVEANLLVVGAGLAVALAVGDGLVSILSKGNVEVPALLLVSLVPVLATHTARRAVELVAYVCHRSADFVRASMVSMLAPPAIAVALLTTGLVHAAPLAVLAVDVLFIGVTMAAMSRAGYPVAFNRERWLRLAAAAAAGGLAGAATQAAVPGAIGTGIAIASGLCVYGLLIMGLRVVNHEDRAWLASILKRRGRGHGRADA